MCREEEGVEAPEIGQYVLLNIVWHMTVDHVC